ncbi:response regulator [Nostoc sp. FACHB-152]|uniref:ATP-binding protein n=1 Tax=unclassified Nostoc TaxID=2593658 RepID=UPI001684B36D|nr:MULTISPECIES: ATP-binding protein [unclassified Nostoc]MBD2448952.1 response regulator [Nostoc sp. FACHB-152]MBD2469420.1 response regulator [Nostoc sp. FACHB-145]
MNSQLAENLFIGDSEMAALMRMHDWSQTSLGAVETWSQSLKTSVRIMLTSRQAMFVWWGDDLINLYNDAYRAILGGKHPQALGQKAAVVWQEIWDQVGPRAQSALLKNQGTYDEALLLIMERNGYPEETYYTFSYSPVPNDDGSTGGIICANTEDTPRIIGERQLALLKELAAKTADARTFDEACNLSTNCLATNPYDLPFAMIYLVDPQQQCVTLAGTCGIDRGHLAVDETVVLDDDSLWQFAKVLTTHETYLLTNLEQQFCDLPTGAWNYPPHQAAVVPIAPSGRTGKAGVLVAALNPFRLFDENYQGFLNLVTSQISASIGNAQAYEEERQRAEALAELDRAKTTFFSNVSHEFRTPLTLMLSPLEELLAKDNLSLDQRQELALMHRNGLRLLKLVNTLLDFSRIEAGRVQAVYEPTDLATFTAELASIFRSAIEQAGLEYIVTCEQLPEAVYIDRSMWEKIVLNLLSNAFKFTFSGAITVILRQVQHQAQLIVRDTGIGIPQAELPQLFERFHRVEGARGRTQEGSGIGLALVQELVRLHGGQVQVESIEGNGTTFSITIPFGTAHLAPERIQATPTLVSTAIGAAPYIEEALRWLPEEAGEQGSRGAGNRLEEGNRQQAIGNRLEEGDREQGTGNRKESYLSPVTYHLSPSSARILLVDDNADMREYVKRLLSQDYVVETATDGIAALEAIADYIPDLVLTDVMMPRLDGFGLLSTLRSNNRTREIPIILLSARAGEEAKVEGLEAGADDYLTKPFSARELLARVEATLKLAQLRQNAMQQEQTLRREAETAKQNVESILSSINDGFYVLDRNWCYTYVNDRLCQIIGMKREQMLERSIWEVFADTVDTEIYIHFHRAFSEQKPIQFEYFYATWNRWYEHRVYPSPDGLTVFAADITERKQAELEREHLLAREFHYVNQLQGLTRAALAINSALSVEQLLRVITDQAASIIGSHQSVTSMTIDQNWGQAITAIYLSDKYAAWRNYDENPDGSGIYANVCRLNQPMRMTQAQLEAHSLWRGFGKEANNHPPMRGWLAAPLVGRDGNNIGLIQLSDKYEGEFSATDEIILIQLAQMASVALENARLYQAEQQARSAAEASKEQAQAANRIKDEFLAVLSHELRSPLNPILGWAKLLQKAKLDEAKTKQALSTIERNAKLQAELIEDLLDVSRILQGKLSLTRSPINLASTIKAAFETVQLAAEAKFIHLEADLDAEIGMVLGDSTRLQQVIWNLLSNAVKFTPSGGQVYVQLSQVDNQAQIIVRDTGKGITPDFLPYVFDYFRQADSATTRKFGGLGLGLAIVRHLVELHGGTIQADSQGEGMGATFSVKLPLSTLLSVDQNLQLSEPSLSLHGIQVLVVDDDTDTRDFVAFVVEQAGAKVITATSARQALQVLTQYQPDMLLSDIGMPEMDGYMLMQQIRALPKEQGGKIPAIALTAYAGELDEKQALKVGFQKHISKPVEPDNLIMAINKLLST